MSRLVQLWSRDEVVLRELKRSPMLVEQLCRLCGFSTPKKASERTWQYERAGLVKSCPFLQNGRQGRAPKVLYQGAAPSLLSLRHTLGVAELRVQSERDVPECLVPEFFYGHECSMSGIRPDAALVVRRADKAVLFLLELDCGTEKLAVLLGKIRAYAAAFDSGQYATDFSWAGAFRGFRVGFVLNSAGRLASLQRIALAENADFVLLTLLEDLRDGLYAPAWHTHDGRSKVDIFGRSV